MTRRAKGNLLTTSNIQQHLSTSRLDVFIRPEPAPAVMELSSARPACLRSAAAAAAGGRGGGRGGGHAGHAGAVGAKSQHLEIELEPGSVVGVGCRDDISDVSVASGETSIEPLEPEPKMSGLHPLTVLYYTSPFGVITLLPIALSLEYTKLRNYLETGTNLGVALPLMCGGAGFSFFLLIAELQVPRMIAPYGGVDTSVGSTTPLPPPCLAPLPQPPPQPPPQPLPQPVSPIPTHPLPLTLTPHP